MLALGRKAVLTNYGHQVESALLLSVLTFLLAAFLQFHLTQQIAGSPYSRHNGTILASV